MTGGRLAGKVAIVTGAASGIGRATAHLFATEGAHVVISDVSDTVHDTARAIGDTAHAIVGDAGRAEDVAALVQAAEDRFGGLDIMFANAGISGGLAGLFDQSAEDFAEILRINLIGPFLAIQHAAPAIAKRGCGSILCTASVAGLRSGAGGVAYSASKAGVINLVQTAAQQLVGSKVRVNAICPGLIQTGMTQMIYDWATAAGKADRIGRLNPLRRGGEPDELAQAALFLASDASSYVNGHALVVDGGLASSHPFTQQNYGQVAI
ncbi:SDR family NAD(P)-dependent oxidoreductase [Sphingomonas prati]|uniref:NAD(P)-dependent dehydrogenase (Short-subunit alcohol dehydrogenase family) n=1 Tax=Sphingomonas prati TaxID=1843237 RepID=A0A7W9F243_9SPHN|nr:SDR family oxidoreductase [Sphingomonas prati]MBB5728105.1 NAD(P)-dependent dehydrogenase (short-subunit alcohol dehydrogenase family) [Sphingomonas prati]GGE83299.1 oxidoreductase [Sphingomonas prati]